MPFMKIEEMLFVTTDLEMSKSTNHYYLRNSRIIQWSEGSGWLQNPNIFRGGGGPGYESFKSSETFGRQGDLWLSKVQQAL
jgi:hypothetical protein